MDHKKYLALLIIPLSIALPGMAQTAFGVHAGLDQNRLVSNTDALPYTGNGARYGYTLGLDVERFLTRRFSVCIAPTLLQKNYSRIRTGPYTGVFEHFTNKYLQVPLTTRWTFHPKKINLFIEGGAYVAYWMSGRVNGRIPDIYAITDSSGSNGTPTEILTLAPYHAMYSFNSKKDDRLEWGLLFGAGAACPVEKNTALSIALDYASSLTDQQKNYMLGQSGRYNRSMILTVSCIYTVGNSKNKKK